MSDHFSPKEVRQIITSANATETRLPNKPKRKKQDFSPNTIIKRKEEERQRSKKRRLETKKLIEKPEIIILIDDLPTNIYTLSVIQLKKFLKSKKVKNDGNKEELIDRIETVSLLHYFNNYQ